MHRYFIFLLAAIIIHSHPYEITLVTNSFDRPMQLYAHLESVKKYIPLLHDVHIIYRASNAKYQEAYRLVQEDFQNCRFHKQGANPSIDYKPLLMQSAFAKQNGYIIFGVDDIIVKDFIDLNMCVEALQKTRAYGFYLRLGKNINTCYSLRKAAPVPSNKQITQEILSWSFSQGTGDWGYPNSVDMCIYNKTDVIHFFRTRNFSNPSALECQWAACPNKKNQGICFNESKVVNIPANLVTQTSRKNRHAQNVGYEPNTLLKKFLDGYKIDITKFYRIANNSPHQEYRFTFILRKGNS